MRLLRLETTSEILVPLEMTLSPRALKYKRHVEAKGKPIESRMLALR
jgi:hypothetical protein